MKLRSLVGVVAFGAIVLSACGGGSYGTSATSPTNDATATPSTTVSTGRSSLGPVLVDSDHLTLYGLTNDDSGTSTCFDACAMAWPPATVDGARLPAGLDPAIFSVVSRPDGTHQLKAGPWPLYRYAGDGAPGDVNGQGSGGVWYVVTPTGALHRS